MSPSRLERQDRAVAALTAIRRHLRKITAHHRSGGVSPLTASDKLTAFAVFALQLHSYTSYKKNPCGCRRENKGDTVVRKKATGLLACLILLLFPISCAKPPANHPSPEQTVHDDASQSLADDHSQEEMLHSDNSQNSESIAGNDGSAIDTPDSSCETSSSEPLVFQHLPAIATDEIAAILATRNSNIINQLNITDADKYSGRSGGRVFVPIFQCDSPAIYIWFNGAAFYTVEKVASADDVPIRVEPVLGTTVYFDETFSFCAGDDIALFKDAFGNGEYEEYPNLRADRQTYHLKYSIGQLQVEFSSYDHEFSEYSIHFFKLHTDKND